MSYSFAYGVTAAHITAVCREGKEWNSSFELPGSNSLLPRPVSGRARPTPHFSTSVPRRARGQRAPPAPLDPLGAEGRPGAGLESRHAGVREFLAGFVEGEEARHAD